MALIAAPQGLEAPRRRIFSMIAATLCRVLADEILLIKQHRRLEIGLGRLRLTVAGNSLVGNDANRRIPADDGALEVGNLDWPAGLCCFRGIHRSSARPASEHGCPCYP